MSFNAKVTASHLMDLERDGRKTESRAVARQLTPQQRADVARALDEAIAAATRPSHGGAT